MQNLRASLLRVPQTQRADTMTGLVDDLLDVSRVTRGLVKLDKTLLDAKKILLEAVEQVGPLIEMRHHRLAEDQDRDAALEAGFDHHFAKPIDSAKLAGLLSEIGGKARHA